MKTDREAQMAGDAWAAGDAYEAYMGRWSRPLAREFVAWLEPGPSAHWLDVGCGTGALTSAILERCAPASVVGCDPARRETLRARMERRLGAEGGAPIRLRARAWAVRGARSSW